MGFVRLLPGSFGASFGSRLVGFGSLHELASTASSGSIFFVEFVLLGEDGFGVIGEFGQDGENFVEQVADAEAVFGGDGRRGF